MLKKMLIVTLLCAGFVISQSSWANYPIVPTFSLPPATPSGILPVTVEAGYVLRPMGLEKWVGAVPTQNVVLDLITSEPIATPYFELGSLGAYKELSPVNYELSIPAGTSVANINSMVRSLNFWAVSVISNFSVRAILTYATSPYVTLWQGTGLTSFPF